MCKGEESHDQKLSSYERTSSLFIYFGRLAWHPAHLTCLQTTQLPFTPKPCSSSQSQQQCLALCWGSVHPVFLSLCFCICCLCESLPSLVAFCSPRVERGAFFASFVAACAELFAIILATSAAFAAVLCLASDSHCLFNPNKLLQCHRRKVLYILQEFRLTPRLD
jgi:hypothetical protein